MATATFTLYDAFTDTINHDIDFSADTIKVMLLNSTFAHDNADTVIGDVSADEVSGTGYTAGGATLANVTWTRSSGVTKLDASDVSWTGLVVTGVKSAVIYRHDASDAAKRHLIASGALDSAAFNVDGDYEIIWNANGILTVTKA